MPAPDLALVKLVAIHEASHSCVASRLGLGIDYCAIKWEADSIGCMNYDSQTYDKFGRGELLLSRATVSVAGEIGEALYRYGRGIDPSKHFRFDADTADAKHVRESLELLPTGIAREDLVARIVANAYSNLLIGLVGVLALADFLMLNLRASGSKIHTYFRK
jgi:hypothetical protein